MKKLKLSKYKNECITKGRLQTLDYDFKEEQPYPIKSNGYHIIRKVFNEKGKTWVCIRWIPNSSRNTTVSYCYGKLSIGDDYILADKTVVRIIDAKVLVRDNVYFWRYRLVVIEPEPCKTEIVIFSKCCNNRMKENETFCSKCGSECDTYKSIEKVQ